MATAAIKSTPSKRRKERRVMSIISIARKTGIILSTGEVWNGTERRGSKTMRKKVEKKEKTTLKTPPANFFG